MSGSLLGFAILQYCDGNGDPLVGGTVGFYQVGAPGVLKTVWANTEKTLVLANPVSLDAAGRPSNSSGEVGIFGDGAYQVLVRDAFGTLQTSGIVPALAVGPPGPTGPQGPPGPTWPPPSTMPRQRLLNYLAQISGNHFLSSQASKADFGEFDADTVALGYEVAVAFCDPWIIPPFFNAGFMARMLAHAASGGIAYIGAEFNNPVTGGGCTDLTVVNPTALLTAGTPSNNALKQMMDLLALDVLQPLKDAGRGVLFRPMQEMDNPAGFWWGQSSFTPAEFVLLWEFVKNYLVGTKGLDNLVFVWSVNGGPGAYQYPGDSLVDVVAIDAYTNTPAVTYGALYNTLRTLAPSKAIMFSEWGSGTPFANNPAFLTQTLVNEIKASMPRICLANAWSGWNWSLETGAAVALTDPYVINKAQVVLP